MIKVVVRQGVVVPIVICDICNQQIQDLERAAAVNPPIIKLRAENPVDIIYAHKGKCHDIAEQRLSQQYGQTAEWQELSTHFYFLCNGGGLTAEKMARKDWMFRELGK